MASSNTSYNLRKACMVVPHQSFPEFLVLVVEGICTSEEGLAQWHCIPAHWFPRWWTSQFQKGLQSIVSCSIGKLIQKYCTWWKFVSLFVCLFCKECHSCMYRFKLLWLHTIQKHALLDLPLHCLHFQYFAPLLHTWFLANSGISRSLSGSATIQICSPCSGLSGSDYDTSSCSDSSSLSTARCKDTWIEMAFLTIQW